MKNTLSNKTGIATIGVLLLASVLTACGGGRAGLPTIPQPQVTPPATQGLTEENYSQVAAVALTNIFFLFNGNTQFINSTQPSDLFLMAARANCEPGSVNIIPNILNEFTSTVGDSASLDHNNCIIVSPGGSRNRLNGRFDIELTDFSTNDLGNLFTVTRQINYSNYTETTTSGAGAGNVTALEGQLEIATDNDINVNVVSQTTTLTAPDSNYMLTLTTAQGERLIYQNLMAASEILDASNNTFTTESDYTLGLLTSITTGTFVVNTTTPFFGMGNMFIADDNGIDENPVFRPTSGVLTITDSNGAVATLEAMTDGVNAQISLDLDGDTVTEVTRIVSYSELDNGFDNIFHDSFILR